MKIAFVFPGQGSQSVGMQAELANAYAVVGDTYREASEVLGFDLWELVQHGPGERLDQTVNTQPAMLTAGVATWRAWRACGGPIPTLLAGHSLGEYSALVVAGAFDFQEAVDVVRQRAELMQNAVPAGEGAMAAILGLDDATIQEVCDTASGIGVAEPVNFNSPGQVVVAGHRAAIQRLIELAKEAGARRAILLHVSVPSHSSLMQGAGDALAGIIDAMEIGDPEIPVVCALDGRPYGDAVDIRARIKTQVYSPVHWVETVKYLQSNGVRAIVECGPGKVLAGLVKRIDRTIAVNCIDSARALQTVLDEAGQ